MIGSKAHQEAQQQASQKGGVAGSDVAFLCVAIMNNQPSPPVSRSRWRSIAGQGVCIQLSMRRTGEELLPHPGAEIDAATE
jgi:hypothetical protein